MATTPAPHKSSLMFFVFLLTYEIAIYLSLDAFLPALPQLGPAFKFAFDPQYAITAWTFGTALLPLFMGPIAARCGDRQVLLSGAVVYLISNVVCATTHSAGLFLFARVTQGACVAAMSTPGYAILHRTLDQKQAIKTLAWMSSITVLAPTAGPLLGALMLTLTTWHSIFVLLAVGTAIAMVGLFVFTPTNIPSETKTVSKGLWHHYWTVLIAPHYLRYKLTQCSFFAALVAWITASPILLMTHHHFSSTQFALAQCAVFSSFILGTRCVGWLLRHSTPVRFLRITTVCAAITSAAGLALTWTGGAAPIGILIASTAVIALLAGLSLSSLDRLAVECCEVNMSYRVAMGGFLFSSFGMLGSLLAGLFDPDQVWQLAGCLGAFTVVAAVLFPHGAARLHQRQTAAANH